MQIGYGVGGNTAIQSSRRRWLAALLAFLIGAAMLFGGAGPASASEAHDATVEGADGGDCSADITVTNTSEDFDDFYVVTEITIYDGEDVIGQDSSPESDNLDPDDSQTFNVSLEEGGTFSATVDITVYDHGESPEVEDSVTRSTTSDFDVDCEDGGIHCEGSCTVTTETYTATITCDDCTVTVEDPGAGFVAQLLVENNSPVDIDLKTLDKGPPPGKAFVLVDPDNGFDFDQLARCTGKKPYTNCVKINRSAGHTHYQVFYDDDPRFKFG